MLSLLFLWCVLLIFWSRTRTLSIFAHILSINLGFDSPITKATVLDCFFCRFIFRECNKCIARDVQRQTYLLLMWYQLGSCEWFEYRLLCHSIETLAVISALWYLGANLRREFFGEPIWEVQSIREINVKREERPKDCALEFLKYLIYLMSRVQTAKS